MAFMEPEYAHGEMHRYTNTETHEDVLVWRGDEPDGDEWSYDRQEGIGWYTRLSASGYMDCTDWEGPFETEEEARGHWEDEGIDPDTGDDIEED